MKFFKYLLLLIVVVVVGGLIYVAMQPSEYDVSRSKIVNASLPVTFNTINNLKTWEDWGPWHDEDSTIVVTYGEKTIGVGASSSWTSKDGPGKMKTVNVLPNQKIEQKLYFADYEPTDLIWTFEKVDKGTKVSWQMKEKNAAFVFKIFAALSGGWDAMLGGMQENGLNNLNKVVMDEEKLANSFTVGEISEVNLKEQKFIGYYHKMKIDMDNMTAVFMKDMPKAGMYAIKSGLNYGDYTPAAAYTKWDEETEETEFYIGLVLHKELKPSEDMNELTLSGGKVVKVAKFGNYGNGDLEAHTKIANYLTKNNLIQKWPIWEMYVNDPTTVKPNKIQTDIYYPVK